MDKVQQLLDEAIEDEFGRLSTEYNTEKRKETVEILTRLHALRIEEARVKQEYAKQQTQAKNNRFERWLNIGVQVGLTALPLIAYNAWYNRGLRFEIDNTIGSPMTRNLVSKLLPRK